MLKRLAFLLIPMMAFAICDKCPPKEKVYVQLEDLIFAEDGIWFRNQENALIVGAEAIHVDSLGYYVSKTEQTWKCAKCGYKNPGAYTGRGCKVCNWPYDSNQ